MRIQCQGDVIAGIAAETAKILFSYYFLSISATPMVLTMACAALALLFNGMKHSMNKEQALFNAVNVELAIYRASDTLLFFLVISNVDLTTFVLIHLLAITATNAVEHRIVYKKMLWLSLVGSILFLRANKLISLSDVAFGASSSIIRIETKKLSAKHTNTIVIQSDIVSDAALCLILWLVTPVERNAFMNNFPDMKFLIISGALAGLAVLYSRMSYQNSRHTATITASLFCGVTSAILTNSGVLLLIVLISLIMVAMAAYNRMEEEPLIDHHYNDIITPRIIQQRNSYATQKLTGVIIVTLVLFIVHAQLQMSTVNTDRHSKPTNTKPNVEILVIDFNDRSMSAGVRKQLRLQCLHKARSMYINHVTALIRPNASISIIHMPNHWNLGDAFLFNGQTTLFNVYGQIIQRSSSPEDNWRSFDLILNRKLDIRDGVLFMTGGGNIGDIYPEADTDRWQVINAIGDNEMYNTRLVMLPQSIHYKSKERLDVARKGYRHRNLTMMLRDDESLQFAKENFKPEKATYVPDSAFMLGPLLPNADPVVDLLFLIRTDTESAIANPQTIKDAANKIGLSAEVWDFPVMGFPEAKIGDQMVRSNVTSMFPGRFLRSGRDQSYDGLVEYRTQLGNSMLSRGRIVITDRLHASIMATLIDRPVIYIDNNYRKTSRVRSSLTAHFPECTDAVLNAYYAPDTDTAIQMAFKLIHRLRPTR